MFLPSHLYTGSDQKVPAPTGSATLKLCLRALNVARMRIRNGCNPDPGSVSVSIRILIQRVKVI